MDKTLFMFWCQRNIYQPMVWNEASYGTGIKICCLHFLEPKYLVADNLAAWTLNRKAGQVNGKQNSANDMQMISKFSKP